MRNSTDLCLLCHVNMATKKNSHIFPKFMSTNFLGENRKGYDLNRNTALDKKPRVIQDSPKEDYILCEDCEAYFGILEGISSETFTNWKGKVMNSDFSIHRIINGLYNLECNTSDPKTMKLLLYSIFWRASISSLELFEDMKIVQDFEDELRDLLLTYKATKKNEYLKLLASKPSFKIFPTTTITAIKFKDKTENILHAPYSSNPYSLIVDRFSFIIFKTPEEIKTDEVRRFSNLTIEDCRILVFSPQLWYDTVLKRPYELFSKQTIKTKFGT